MSSCKTNQDSSWSWKDYCLRNQCWWYCFLKNKRVDTLLNALSKYLVDTTDKCTSETEEIMIKENAELLQEVVRLIKK